MSQFELPSFDFKAPDLVAEFDRWTAIAEMHMNVRNIITESKKKDWLILSGGPEMFNVYESTKNMTVTDTTVAGVYEQTKWRLRAHLSTSQSRQPTIEGMYQLFKCRQVANESISDFIDRLELMADVYNLPAQMRDFFLSTVVACRCISDSVRSALLDTSPANFNLSYVKRLATSVETILDLQQIIPAKRSASTLSTELELQPSFKKTKSLCYSCGELFPHKRGEICKAKDRVCSNCGGIGHLKVTCRKPTSPANLISHQKPQKKSITGKVEYISSVYIQEKLPVMKNSGI